MAFDELRVITTIVAFESGCTVPQRAADNIKNTSFDDLPHALQHIDIHFSCQVLCVKAVDHLDARSGISRKGQQAHILAFNEAEHDCRMPEGV